MKEQGQGGPEGASQSQKDASSKEQGGRKVASEAGKDYSGMLSSIRADRDLETFVAGVRQNKEQLLSFTQELISREAVSAKTAKDAKDSKALAIYMNFAIRSILSPNVFAFEVFSTNPADWRDTYTHHKPMTEAEKRELRADRAARRVASKWMESHPDSGAAMDVRDFGIDSAVHDELLQEMWTVILPQLTRQSEEQSSPRR